MFSADIRVEDLATPKLRALLDSVAPAQRRVLLGRLGKELEVQLKAHFAQRDKEPNKAGFPRSHFWNREVRQKTALRSFSADQATVGIASRPFRQRLRGGTIRPGPGKRFLAIPMRAEAYGVNPSARTIPDIFVVRSKILGKAWLAREEGGALRFYWRLVPSVHQEKDPRALPPIEDLRAALERRGESEIRRVIEQG